MPSVQCITRELGVDLYARCESHATLETKYQAGQRQNDGRY
jgi:hypothetical protein